MRRTKSMLQEPGMQQGIGPSQLDYKNRIPPRSSVRAAERSEPLQQTERLPKEGKRKRQSWARDIILVVIVAGVLLTVWNFFNQSNFYRDYFYDGYFTGRRYECMVGGLNPEARTLCFMGADELGVYILPHPKPRKLFWGDGCYIFKKSVLIPWKEIECSTGKILFE